MRRLFILLLICLLAGVGLVALIETDPGYVLVSYGLTTIETSLWVALLLLFVFNLAFYYLWRFLHKLLATRGAFSQWLSLRAYSRELSQLEKQLASGDAASVIHRLAGIAPSKHNDQELRLLARAYSAAQDWPSLIELLPALKKKNVVSEAELNALELQAYTGVLEVAAIGELKQTWQRLPGERRKQVELVECYGRRLLESGDDMEAEKVLSKAIKRGWDGRLVAQYGRIRGRDPARRLKLAESWLKTHPEDPSLMLCLGRLSQRNDLWGKARDYFEASHRMQPSAEACAELARLLFSLGEREKSAQYYREGLLLRETNLPDLPLPHKRSTQPGRD